MKKIIITVLVIIILILIIILGITFYHNYRIEHAYKKVILKKEEVEVFENIKLKDLIKEINGTLEKNIKIDTTKIGKKEISFYYTTDKLIKVPYTININVVDKTPPLISMPKEKVIIKGSTTKKEFLSTLFCGDNYDDNPKCSLEGDYNLEKIGDYKVTYKGVDSSNNKIEYSFPLKVVEKDNNKESDSNSNNYILFEEIKNKYKSKNTKIGIDISYWQGDIDFKKVKESGVEFVYIRVGRGNGIGKEYIEDKQFKRNIKGFNKVNIPVGVYFYSYASNKTDAINEAKWVMNKIKNYKVDKEIVFDWENWSFYNEFHLSFYHLTEIANNFIKTVEKKGYKGMLYSSKNYLENVWFKTNSNIWLAHYIDKTNYEGKYNVWQICNNGKIDGINDNYVDIDILYE